MAIQTSKRIKQTLIICLVVIFLLSVTAAAVDAAKQHKKVVVGGSGITATPSSGPPPLTVTFTAKVSSTYGIPPTGYAWKFGDGNTGTGQTTTNTYNNPGTYNVVLTVTDSTGSTNSYKTTVKVEGLSVDFKATGTRTGSAPFDVDFQPEVSSNANIESSNYDWSFGDGSPHYYGQYPPTHTYKTSGSYSVSLTVTDNNGLTATENKPNYITVT